jgi:Tfp pilus assembly PilM family ATPase
LPEKKREGYAFLLDIGFVTSSLSVVYGNGIVHEESFNCGIASVLVEMIKTLGLDFSVAEEMLSISNISGGSETEKLTYTTEEETHSLPVNRVNEVIKCAVDALCERLDAFLHRYYREKNSATMSVNPISITGEGVWGIKGITEHIENRIGWVTETVYPDLPFYDKPTASSKISLLNMALNDQKKNTNAWQKLLRRLGGKKV